MPRIRSVHPDICTDEGLAEQHASAERLYVRLWTHLDDDGRCVENVKLLKAALFPLHDDYTIDDLAADLDCLVGGGQLIRYEVAGKRYLTAKPERWALWQKPRRKVDSKLPAPSCADIVGTPRDDDRTRAAGGVGGDVEETEMDKETEGESEGEPEQAVPSLRSVDNLRSPVALSLVERALTIPDRIKAGNELPA